MSLTQSKKRSDKKYKRRVLVADDHPVVCKALCRIINRQADLTCCGIVDSVTSTFDTVDKCPPDLVLLDLNFKDGDGISLIKSLLKNKTGLRVLVLSQDEEETCAEGLLKIGVRGYISKVAPVEEILTAIRTVLAGNVYSNNINRIPLQKSGGDAIATAVDGKVAKLTKRELEVLQLLGSGMRTRHIASQFNLSIKTIETYREHLKEKLCFDNSTELIHFAILWKGRQPHPEFLSR